MRIDESFKYVRRSVRLRRIALCAAAVIVAICTAAIVNKLMQDRALECERATIALDEHGKNGHLEYHECRDCFEREEKALADEVRKCCGTLIQRFLSKKGAY